MSRSPFSPEERARIAQEYLDGKGSSYEIAREYGIHNETVRQWARRYAEQGILAFERGNGNTRYSKEFKTKCVEHISQEECPLRKSQQNITFPIIPFYSVG